MTIEEILRIEGITVRLIPADTVSLYTYREDRKLTGGQTIFTRNGRKFVREVKPNGLGGKYFVRITNGQGAVVHFSTRHDGVGDTIEAAYADYLAKAGQGGA